METVLKFIIATCGATISYLWGEWSALLGALLFVVAFDYVTGVIAAWFEGKLKSGVGLKGIARKFLIFAVVAMAHIMDTILGDNHLLRDAAIFFYIVNELLSITENLGRAGVPLPPALKKGIEVLRTKGDSK
jgi:toxin secretion/phage lysis holin